MNTNMKLLLQFLTCNPSKRHQEKQPHVILPNMNLFGNIRKPVLKIYNDCSVGERGLEIFMY